MNNSLKLSLEQQFRLHSFETQVQQMNRAQAQDFLIELFRQMIVKERLYKELIKNEWNLGSPNL